MRYYNKIRFVFLLCMIFMEAFSEEQSYNMEKLEKMITEEALEEAFEVCHNKLAQREELERELVRRGRVIDPTDGSADLSLIPQKIYDPNFIAREKVQLVFEEATNLLINQSNLAKDDIEIGLPRYPLKSGLSKSDQDTCENLKPHPTCNPNSKYRTADGSCSNLNDPTWGMTTACQPRIMPAFFEGASGYRISVSGGPLPEPRLLSLKLNSHLNVQTNEVTHMYTFFGQLLDHDIALTPRARTVDRRIPNCCPPASETHPECRPIIVQKDDPFYSQFGITCLNFVRSAICPTCDMGHRQVMNALTSVIDASFVYDNSENATRTLRAMDGTGRLRTQNSNSGPLMPPSPNPDGDSCSFPDTNEICFHAGDGRANQNPVLTSLHTIFLREHNRLATELKRINPHWGEERLFQEARRIVGAQMQVITYKEYLPITIGELRMNYFQLYVSDTESTVHNSNVNPTLILEFSTAAFRFGHSMVNSVIARSPLNATNGRRLLKNEFFQPFELHNYGFIGQLVSGVSNSPSQWFDQNIVEDLTNHLYKRRGRSTGLDLAAININRGRDHGIPPYIHLLRLATLGHNDVKNFDDLVSQKVMRSEQVRDLRRNYRDVADVDLWIGMLMENPIDDAVLGPTAAGIIGLQFHNLKYGDRFYFEHRDQAGSFTFHQRMELKKTTLSTIMCLNSDAVRLPGNAMLFRTKENPSVNCRSVTGIDLSYWKE